jgi:hypothetical protein
VFASNVTDADAAAHRRTVDAKLLGPASNGLVADHDAVVVTEMVGDERPGQALIVTEDGQHLSNAPVELTVD